jgi:hypothetical protein
LVISRPREPGQTRMSSRLTQDHERRVLEVHHRSLLPRPSRRQPDPPEPMTHAILHPEAPAQSPEERQ